MAAVLWLLLLATSSGYLSVHYTVLEQTGNTEVTPLNAFEKANYRFWIKGADAELPFALIIEFPAVSYTTSALTGVTCAVNSLTVACEVSGTQVVLSVSSFSNSAGNAVDIKGVTNPYVYPAGTGIFRAWTAANKNSPPFDINFELESVGLLPPVTPAFCYDAVHVETNQVQAKTALSFTISSLVDIPAGSIMRVVAPAEFTVLPGSLPCKIWGVQVSCSASGQTIEAVGTPYNVSQLNSDTRYLNLTVSGLTNPAFTVPARALEFKVSVLDKNKKSIYNQCVAKSSEVTAGAVTIHGATYVVDVAKPIYGGWSVVDISFQYAHAVPAKGYIYIRLNNPIYNNWYDSTVELGSYMKTAVDYCCIRQGLDTCLAGCARMRSDSEQYHYELMISGAAVALAPQNVTIRVMMELWYEPVVAEIETRTADDRVVDATFSTPELAIPQVSSSAYSSDSFISRDNFYLSFGSAPLANTPYGNLVLTFTSSVDLKTNAKVLVTLDTSPGNFRFSGPPVSCSATYEASGILSTSDSCGLENGNRLFFYFNSAMKAKQNSVKWTFADSLKLYTPVLATSHCLYYVVRVEMYDDSGNALYQTNYPLFLYSKASSDLYKVVTPWNADVSSHLTQWKLKFNPTVAAPFQAGQGETRLRFTCDGGSSMVESISDVNGVKLVAGTRVAGFQFSGFTDTSRVIILLEQKQVNHPNAGVLAVNNVFTFTVRAPEILKTETSYEVSVLANGPTTASPACAAEYSYVINCESYRIETHFSSLSGLGPGASSSWFSIYQQTSADVGSLTNVTLKGSLSQNNPALVSCWLPSTWKFTTDSTLLLDGSVMGNVTFVNDWATVISGRTWGDATLNKDNSYITLTGVQTPACAAESGTLDSLVCYFGTYSNPSTGYFKLSNALTVSQLHSILQATVEPSIGVQAQTDAAYGVSFQLGYGVSSGASIIVRINSALGDTGLVKTSQGFCSVNAGASCTYQDHVFNITLQERVSPFQTLKVDFSGLENPVLAGNKIVCDFQVVISVKVTENCVNSYSGAALNLNRVCLEAPRAPARLSIDSFELLPSNADAIESAANIFFSVNTPLRQGTTLNFTFPAGSIDFSYCTLYNDLTASCRKAGDNVIEVITAKSVSSDILSIFSFKTTATLTSNPVTVTAIYGGSSLGSYKYYRPVQASTFTNFTIPSYVSNPASLIQAPISTDFRVNIWPSRTEGEKVKMTFTFVPRVSLHKGTVVAISFPAEYGSVLHVANSDYLNLPCRSPSLGSLRCECASSHVHIYLTSSLVSPPYVEHVVEIEKLWNPKSTGVSTGAFSLLVMNSTTLELLDYDLGSVLGSYLFEGQPKAIVFNPVPLDTSGRLVSPERSVNFTVTASDLVVGHAANYTFAFPADRAYNFSMITNAAMVGVQFPPDYSLNNFIDAILLQPNAPLQFVADKVEQAYLQAPCELQTYGDDRTWAVCVLYENQLLLQSPPKDLKSITVKNIRNPNSALKTMAFTLKIYENYVNDFSFLMYDAGGMNMNITYQTYPSLGDYSLSFATSPPGFDHYSYNEELKIVPAEVTANPGTVVAAHVQTWSGMPNYDMSILFTPIVLNSWNEVTEDVLVSATSWNFLLGAKKLDFTVTVLPTAATGTYTIYWQYEEHWWNSGEVFIAPDYAAGGYSYFNHTSVYLAPQPMKVSVASSPAAIHLAEAIAPLPRGSVRSNIRIVAEAAPCAPLTLVFTPDAAGITVVPQTLTLQPGQTEALIAVSVASSAMTVKSTFVAVEAQGDVAASFAPQGFGFDIREVRNVAYTLDKIEVVAKNKTQVTFSLSSSVGGTLKWAVAAEGTPAPLPADILAFTPYDDSAPFLTHLLSVASGEVALSTQTQLTVTNLRASTKYSLFTYVRTDLTTVGPLTEFGFSTLDYDPPVFLRLIVSRQPSEGEYVKISKAISFLLRLPTNRIKWSSMWAVQAATNSSYIELMVAPKSAWENVWAPEMLVQPLRLQDLGKYVDSKLLIGLEISSEKVFAPQFVQAPAVRSVQQGAILLEALLEQPGTISAVAVKAGDLAPSSLQVIFGLNSRNEQVPTGKIASDGSSQAIWSIEGLSANVYDVYVTTEDLKPFYAERSMIVKVVKQVNVKSGVYTEAAYDPITGSNLDLVSVEELSFGVMRQLSLLLFVLLSY